MTDTPYNPADDPEVAEQDHEVPPGTDPDPDDALLEDDDDETGLPPRLDEDGGTDGT